MSYIQRAQTRLNQASDAVNTATNFASSVQQEGENSGLYGAITGAVQVGKRFDIDPIERC